MTSIALELAAEHFEGLPWREVEAEEEEEWEFSMVRARLLFAFARDDSTRRSSCLTTRAAADHNNPLRTCACPGSTAVPISCAATAAPGLEEEAVGGLVASA